MSIEILIRPKMLLPKQAENAEMARLEDFQDRKTFRPRPLPLAAIYSLTSGLNLPESSSYFESLSAGMEDLDGRLRRKIRET